MSRKGENIYKRKDGRWEGRYLKTMPDGKRRYGYVYAPTYREAKSRLRKAEAQWQTRQKAEKAQALSLAAMAALWEQNIMGQVKESTFVKYHTVWEKHLCPALGQTSVEEMTHERIEDFALSLLRGERPGSRPLSARTVGDILSVLRSILRFARRTGAVVPCDGSSVRIRRNPTQIRVLTMAEQTQLCRHLYADLTNRNLGILLCLFAGLRVGELCALRWEDISLEDGTLTVSRTMQRIKNLEPEGPRTKILISSPKTATSARIIPLPRDLLGLLERQSGARRGYFLTGEESYLEPRAMEYYFAGTVRQLGFPPANFHALRHTFATRCVELGFDVKSLSELLGHSTVSMTLNRYVHPTIEHKRETMQRLTAIMPAAS